MYSVLAMIWGIEVKGTWSTYVCAMAYSDIDRVNLNFNVYVCVGNRPFVIPVGYKFRRTYRGDTDTGVTICGRAVLIENEGQASVVGLRLRLGAPTSTKKEYRISVAPARHGHHLVPREAQRRGSERPCPAVAAATQRDHTTKSQGNVRKTKIIPAKQT